MRKFLALAVLAAALSGCAPKMIASNDAMVMVGASPYNAKGATQIAEAECNKFGKHARLNPKPGEDDYQWASDCVR